MSYDQSVKWTRKHPKGTRQPVLMHTNSGFWPARAWILESWQPYLERCRDANAQPLECEAFYRSQLGNRWMDSEPVQGGRLRDGLFIADAAPQRMEAQ